MKKYYLKFILILLFVLSKQIYGQTAGTMDFGSSTVVLTNATNPSHDFSSNSLPTNDNDKLNGFDMSANTSGNIFLAFALNGNSAGTNAIAGPSDAILGWIGNGSSSVIDGTLKTDTGNEIGLTSMHFAYELVTGSNPTTFTFTGKRDGLTVGTLELTSPPAISDITLDFTSPTTGSFTNIDEIIFTPSSPIFGGFSIDDMVVITASSNTAPVITGTAAGQTVNDNATISPFSAITTTDADGDNLSATITLDNNAKGLLSGTDLTGTGPYNVASTTAADLQAKLRALSFNPTDNRTSSSETTTFTVAISDGVDTDTNNTTTVISSAVAPTVTEVNSFTTNGTYSPGSDIIISVTFSESVTVIGTPQITLETGLTDRTVDYNGTGNGSNTLLFTYTIQSGDISADLDYVATSSLTSGTSIQDTGGSNATLTLASPGTAGSLGANKALVIDGVAPVAPVVVSPSTATTVNATTQTISGTHTENGVTIHAYADNDNNGEADNTTSLGSATVTGNAWSFAVNLTTDSTNNFVVTAEDPSGNTSNDIDVATITQTTTVTWTGASDNDWLDVSNWYNNTPPTSISNVIIPNGLTNYPTITSEVTVNSINIASGATLIADAAVNAVVTYNRNIPDTNWHLVSAPVFGETFQDIIDNNTFATGTGTNIGIGIYVNSGVTPWFYATNPFPGTTDIPSGIGTSMKLENPGNITISGILLPTTNHVYPISLGNRTNFNLLGNPYTSYINSAILTADNTAFLTEETVWLWNGTQYETYNAVNPIEIAPGQGFFVEAAADNNFVFPSTNRSHQSTDTFLRQEPIANFELFVENGTNKNSTKVFYVEGKTTGFDNGYDSKMFGDDEQSLAVFTQLITDNEHGKLAIQTLPDTFNATIPVGLIAKANEEITFSIESLNLPEGAELFLEDRKNNEFINLSQGAYTTTLSEDANGAGQFYITTSAKSLSTNDLNLDSVSIYKSSSSEITIAGLNSKASVSIFSLLGKEVVKTTLDANGVNKINLPILSSGVYIISLDSKEGSTTKKITLD